MISIERFTLCLLFVFVNVVQINCEWTLHDTECITRVSLQSSTFDDAVTSVACAPDEVMTGCTSHTYWKHMDGSYILHDRCYAVNGAGGGGVWASARCCKITVNDCYDVESSFSGSGDDNIGVALCQASDHVLTSCTMATSWQNIDGAYPGNSAPQPIGTLVETSNMSCAN